MEAYTGTSRSVLIAEHPGNTGDHELPVPMQDTAALCCVHHVDSFGDPDAGSQLFEGCWDYLN